MYLDLVEFMSFPFFKLTTQNKTTVYIELSTLSHRVIFVMFRAIKKCQEYVFIKGEYRVKS